MPLFYQSTYWGKQHPNTPALVAHNAGVLHLVDTILQSKLKKVKEYLGSMVLSRTGPVVHPCIKEAVVPPPLRTVTRRVGELPSLRYGPIGNSTSRSGPLRVSNAYQYETIPKGASRKKNGVSGSSESLAFKPIKPTRRVRFDLPPSDGEPLLNDAVTGGVPDPPAARATRSRSHRPNGGLYNHVPHHEEERAYPTTTTDALADGDGSVAVAVSPAPRHRVHPTGRYVRGTLSPTANPPTAGPQVPPGSGGAVLLRAARDAEDALLRDLLRKAALAGIPEADLNAVDNSGRTALSYIASNGSVDLLDHILTLPGLDPNRPDNEGNTPLHFAAQAGQVECLNVLLSRCKGIEIDARNNLGFTPLMKAALQGRNKCAKLLLFAGANPTLRDSGRGLRADQWARFCGRYVCADVIEKHARQRLLERSTSYGNWGGENDMGARVLLGKVVPVPQLPQQQHGLKSRLKKVFRTSSGPGNNLDHVSSARLVTQLTTAALCASSPVLPSAPSVPPMVKSLIRPLTVPRLQVTLASSNSDEYQGVTTNGVPRISPDAEDKEVVKAGRTKKKK